MGCIYAIENLENGKVYIGSSVVRRARQRWHRWALGCNKHPNEHLQRSWNFYGESAFAFMVLENNIPAESLNEREQEWLDVARLRGAVYNMQDVANWPASKRRLTDEQKEKVSKGLRGKPLSEEHKRRISASRVGYRHTLEARAKMSRAKRGRKCKPFSDGHCRHLSEALTGRTRTEEHCHNLSESCKGKKMPPFSDEHRRKIGEGRAGPYPAFVHQETGEVIPQGRNLSALCREYGLARCAMRWVIDGTRNHHKGWKLL